MRKFAVVTTCHGKGFELYGRAMIETFEKYWPREITLHVYVEGFEPELQSDRIVYHDLYESSPGLIEFKERHRDNPEAHGSGDRPRWLWRVDWRKLKFKLRRKTTLGYQWDAVRFSHKMFAVFAAVKDCDADVLFWSDADTRFLKPISLDFVDQLIPDDIMLSYLARPRFTECGFVGYNLRHPQIGPFFSDFEDLYTRDLLFKESQWHDSFLFDVLRKRYERKGVKNYDIAEGVGRTAGHVFINSRLGEYMDHVKGDRKEAGVSPDSDRLS